MNRACKVLAVADGNRQVRIYFDSRWMKYMNILVTGATGFVGSALITTLLRTDHSISALTRDAASYASPEGIRVIEADLLDQASLKGIFNGVDVVYYLVHSLETGPSFAQRDRDAARNFTRAASEGGVHRVIYLGGLGETGEDLSEHLRSRREVEEFLAEGTFALTTLRAAIIVGRGSSSFTMIRQLVERLPLMITPQWVRTQCQPIAIQDVIAYLVGVLDVPETADDTFEIGGPDVLTYQEMLIETGKQLGKHPLIIPVPVLSPALSVYWVDLVTDVSKNVAHPLIYGLKNAVVVRDNRIREYLPIKLTPFEDAVALALHE